VRWSFGVIVAATILCACQEKLTSPADCPALCPGGTPQVFDTVLTAVAGADSTYTGYVQAHQAAAMPVTNGLEGFEQRGLVRFLARGDSVTLRDTLRGYTIDSVSLSFTLVTRDTTTTGLELLLYRVGPRFDSTTTYTDVAPAFVPESLVAVVPIADTVNSGILRTVLQGADLSKVQLSPADSGNLAIGLRLSAPTFTGVRIGALAGNSSPVFTTYATLDVPDTGTAKLRNIALTAGANTTVSEAPPLVMDTTLLAVGGAPSSRSLIRFDLPPRIRDSATIVRASIELTPVAPIIGLPNTNGSDTLPTAVVAKPLLADVGAKSPVSIDPRRIPKDTLDVGATGVSLEAVRLVELWIGFAPRPSSIMLSLEPEASSFSHPVFYSSRALDPALRPRLRLSYLLRFPFEGP